MAQTENRRPIASRNSRLTQAVAAKLAARKGITPNRISLAGAVFAAAGAAVMLTVHPAGLVTAAVCIQLRLLCNLFDGMVAVEGGQKTPAGELFNEFPDRIADSLFLVAAGYAADSAWLGWLAALAAALTAYVRVFGGSVGLKQSFRGPMAKQHRMAVLTAACLLGAWEVSANGTMYVFQTALLLIASGSLATCFFRARDIASELNRRAAENSEMPSEKGGPSDTEHLETHNKTSAATVCAAEETQ
ncbi:MAG: CDP-alcohol phosphatidyltransferase family protein [Neisseria sp.]|nr:CDP-alcohol phosphatidyltransferase family protein [Neisseria sp.]